MGIRNLFARDVSRETSEVVEEPEAPEVLEDNVSRETSEVVEEPEAPEVLEDNVSRETSELKKQLHLALVRLDGRLIDPEALQFDEANLLDNDKLSAAITKLIEANPHMSATSGKGDIGQGVKEKAQQPFDLISTMRNMQGLR